MWRMYSIDGVLFILHRITGITLFIYLITHILTISTAMLAGPDAFDRVMATLAGPKFLIIDLALFGSLLFHALNGLRLIAHEHNFWLDQDVLLSKAVLGAWSGLIIVSAIFILAN